MQEPWWVKVHDAAQLLVSRLDASVAHAARVGVYIPPLGSPPLRRRRQPGSLRHLAEVIRSHRLAPGMSIDKDDVAAVLSGDLRRLTNPVLVVAVARASHLIADVPFDDVDADRLVVACAHVSALVDAAQRADARAGRAVPALRVAAATRSAGTSAVDDGRPTGEPVVIDAYFTTRRPGRRRALGAAALCALLVACAAALLVLHGRQPSERRPAAAPAPSAVAGVTPLEHGLAHNDYLNPRPLSDALDHGFTSIQVDVLLHDGRLLLCAQFRGGICADRRNTRIAAKPFESTYLQGLSARVSTNGGRVYPGYNQPVVLFVEITCVEGPSGCQLPSDRTAAAADQNNPLVVARKVMSALVAYRSMLYHVDNMARRWAPVQIVITGSHNDDRLPAGAADFDSVRGLLTRQLDTYAFLDGSFGVDRDLYDADLVPVISFQDPAMNNDCTYNSERSIQTVHWDDIVKAQSTGHHVRVREPAGCPDRGDAWTDALYAGVDYLSSDHLAPLAGWLTGNAVGGGGGNCALASWIAKAKLYGQYCTLKAGTVPVMSQPDAHSPLVGDLPHGGVAWFLGQQPGTAYTYHSATNLWWAYTRADNGQWGWVSLVYFADAGADQSADGLQYGCYDVRPGEPDNCHNPV